MVSLAESSHPDHIEVRGARVHNLRSVDIDVPLGRIVAVAGVSGSGKSSLALGVLYSEGSRRYLEALSTYTRRRMTQAAEAKLDSIDYVPAALALHQRPSVPGVRSTFGTMSELLNHLRLMFSRLGSHMCPNGHLHPPSMDVAAGRELVCPVCGVGFEGPGAESMAFNSEGACPRCSGTGVVREVDRSRLVPDWNKTLQEGAVESWNMFGINWMYRVAESLGVRVDVPFKDLTDEERSIVYDGPEVTKLVAIESATGKVFDLNCTYRNAVRAVEEALSKANSEKGIQRVERYLTVRPCEECGGTRLNGRVRSTLLRGINLAEATSMTLGDLMVWVSEVPSEMPEHMRPMAESICGQFLATGRRLMDLGLDYLSLDRAGSTLSTGERQRVQLARALRNRTTGVMYVLDEPSIGLHPSNLDGMMAIVRDLVDHGNSVILVDHDVRALRMADWLIEMGPGAGSEGGTVVSQGTVSDIEADPDSVIAPYLRDGVDVVVRRRAAEEEVFALGEIRMGTSAIHTVRPLDVRIPRGRMTVVTGVSGSGKTTMVLESLVPALESHIAGSPMPDHVVSLDAGWVRRVNVIDATPIGTNVRSTVATYSGVLDDLRRMFARAESPKAAGYGAGDFSYNTGRLRCPECDGTGQITLDVQFLPDVDIVCPVCGGSRYSREASSFRISPKGSDGSFSLPELMSMTVDRASEALKGTKVAERLATMSGIGLGYLTLGEATPALSGGEAQRLKLASEMGRSQDGTVFVFDEPTIGLHPRDVRTLIGVFQRLMDDGATLIVIEHDLDLIANADHVIDMGPGGGEAGGRIVSSGTVEHVASDPASVTGRYLRGSIAGTGPIKYRGSDNVSMAKLTQEILDQMKNQKVYALATASKDGVPNVVPVGMLIPKEDGTIWIIDNYFGKTIANMEENPKAAFYVWNPECKESWQVKGTLTIEDSGADYEAAVAFAHSIKEIFPAKHLVKMTVDEVYYVTPGDHAGKKIE